VTEVLDINTFKIRAAAERAFASWRKRFRGSFDIDTRLIDLADETICFLAEPGEETALAFYDLILGALNIGRGLKFYYMEDKHRLMVIDIHLFLVDQVRFECMHRLGWVESFPGERYPIIYMVLNYKRLQEEFSSVTPQLARNQPDYIQFQQLSPMEQENFIRRMIPRALIEFKKRLGLE